MIEIVPAIDIIGGKCVRLTKGDYGTTKVYDLDPVDMAKSYQDCGVKRIHLVDLDGAKAGSPSNLRTLEAIATGTCLTLEWGGGISSDEALRQVFNAGSNKAIVGSVAAMHPELFSEWLITFSPEKMILGADVRGRNVAVKGWMEDSPVTIDSLMDRFTVEGLKEMICTDISKDGMLQGPSFSLYEELQNTYPDADVCVSGGISCMEDIEKLNDMGLRRVIVGKAIYEKRISLKDIESWSLRG